MWLEKGEGISVEQQLRERHLKEGGWLAEKVQMRGSFWREGKLSGKIGSETFMVKLGVKLSSQHVLLKLSLLELHFDLKDN